MNSTPIISMFSGTGELDRAVSTALVEPSCPVSFSDTYGPARKYLRHRFPDVEVCKDFCDQDVPEGSIVTIGAPCQDLSVAGEHAGAERGSGTRSSLIHKALDMAVAGGADLIVAENVPGGHSVYLSLACGSADGAPSTCTACPTSTPPRATSTVVLFEPPVAV